LASVVLLAGALTWGVVDNLNRPGVAAPPAAGDRIASAPVTPPGVGGTASGRDTRSPERPLPETSASDKKNPDPAPPAPAAANSGTAAAGTIEPRRPPGRGRSAGSDERPANASAAPGAAGKEPSTSPSTPPSTPAATVPPPVVVTPPKIDPETPKKDEPAPVRGESAAPPPTTKPVDERKTSPPPAPAPVPDEASLRRAVELYEAAITSGKPDAIRAVFPSISDREIKEVEALKFDFGQDRYRLNIFIRAIRIDGTRARVECGSVHNGVDDRGKLLTKPKQETLNFQWTGATWVRVR
jgi:hypothetical protein